MVRKTLGGAVRCVRKTEVAVEFGAYVFNVISEGQSILETSRTLGYPTHSDTLRAEALAENPFNYLTGFQNLVYVQSMLNPHLIQHDHQVLCRY